ncbi:MAG: Gfo/Idh/MocA family oxidoreductase [Gemmataceae bacterium]
MPRKPFSPVKLGVIGLGRFGRLHALTAAALAEAELVTLVSRRQESLDALARELPGVTGWTNLEHALVDSEAEAWIVACATSAHVPITRTLLEAGKTVLLEKPISSSLEEARSLRPLVRADSGNLMIGHIVLFNSEYQQLRDEARLRGPIVYIDCVRHRPNTTLTGVRGGENPLHATMVHDLYATQVLLDRAEPASFSAAFHRSAGGAVDLAVARLHWANGPVASFSASYLTPAGMPPRGFDRMEVFGAGWAARIQPNPRPIEVWREDRADWPLALEIRAGAGVATGMMAEEIRCFCRVVRGRESVPVGATYADALQVQEWMDRLEACAT